MPIFQLPDEPSLGYDTYGSAIVAVMLFPREREAADRQHWHAAAAAHSYVDLRGKDAPWQVLAAFHGCVGDLWELPQSPRRVFQDGTTRMRRAFLSGKMLDFLLRLAAHHPAHCRVERAKVLVREVQGRKAPSESSLEKIWANFKSVSPLWLALWVEREHGGGMLNNSRWLDMLARAETYRKLAEAHRILGPTEAWRPEPTLSLPSSEIDLLALPKELLAVLDRDFPY
jgi:hypothetical protein